LIIEDNKSLNIFSLNYAKTYAQIIFAENFSLYRKHYGTNAITHSTDVYKNLDLSNNFIVS